MQIQALMLRARQAQQIGRMAEAESLYRQVLAQQPDHTDALFQLGQIALRTGQHAEAIALLSRLIEIAPKHPTAHNLLGATLGSAGRLEEAAEAFRQAISLQPGAADAHCNFGNVLKRIGRVDEALLAFDRAVRLRPAYAEAHLGRGNCLESLHRFDEAIAAITKAISLKPTLADAHFNLGVLLSKQERQADAIVAYRAALRLNPTDLSILRKLGEAQSALAQYDAAIDTFRQVLTRQPNHVEAIVNLGVIMVEIARLDDAITLFDRALEIEPDNAFAQSNRLFATLYHPRYTAEMIATEHREWGHRTAAGFANGVQDYQNARVPDRRLRVGYVSGDFSTHVVGLNLLPLFRQRDREAFEVFCYSNRGSKDAVAAEFRSLADQWREIEGVGDEEVARQIREDQIDVLVDLALHTADNRLGVFARKPAPVAFTFAGYPGGTGLPTVDYRLTDPYLDPLPTAGDSSPDYEYSEKSIRLPASFWCYAGLAQESIAVNELPALSRGQFTFGCLNTFTKISDATLALWAKVLAAVPGSRLLMRAPEGRTWQKVQEIFAREGVAPYRLVRSARLKRMEYFSLYNEIDLMLDSLPYNGHTTSLDAFWMGVPVVTLVGSTVVGRAGLSQASNLGLTELVAYSEDRFIGITAELAQDLPRLARMRLELRDRMSASPLMDAVGFTRGIERAYRLGWKHYCGGDTLPLQG